MTTERGTVERDRDDVQGEAFQPLRRAPKTGTTTPDRTRSRSAKARTLELRAARRRKGLAR
jgi:hypothetical protein